MNDIQLFLFGNLRNNFYLLKYCNTTGEVLVKFELTRYFSFKEIMAQVSN